MGLLVLGGISFGSCSLSFDLWSTDVDVPSFPLPFLQPPMWLPAMLSRWSPIFRTFFCLHHSELDISIPFLGFLLMSG